MNDLEIETGAVDDGFDCILSIETYRAAGVVEGGFFFHDVTLSIGLVTCYESSLSTP